MAPVRISNLWLAPVTMDINHIYCDSKFSQIDLFLEKIVFLCNNCKWQKVSSVLICLNIVLVLSIKILSHISLDSDYAQITHSMRYMNVGLHMAKYHILEFFCLWSLNSCLFLRKIPLKCMQTPWVHWFTGHWFRWFKNQ